MNYDRVAIYLNDHLAAISAEIELAARCQKSNSSESWSAELSMWKIEMEAQLEAVKLLLTRINRGEDHLKQALAWLAEKAGRFKLNDSLINYSMLSQLIELEMLLTAARMRQTMWAVLGKYAPQTLLGDAVDYRTFHDEAARQVEAVQTLCETSVFRALGEQSTS